MLSCVSLRWPWICALLYIQGAKCVWSAAERGNRTLTYLSSPSAPELDTLAHSPGYSMPLPKPEWPRKSLGLLVLVSSNLTSLPSRPIHASAGSRNRLPQNDGVPWGFPMPTPRPLNTPISAFVPPSDCRSCPPFHACLILKECFRRVPWSGSCRDVQTMCSTLRVSDLRTRRRPWPGRRSLRTCCIITTSNSGMMDGSTASSRKAARQQVSGLEAQH
ncbi:hypothetical protein IWZ00DRAFT_208841 [Phyllosticta capitalensis]|uniref:Secreted protein n=1 Tax=Phyllosticta capitalensis TaxID=121624 RepID=A0ABR1YSY7_9PEZI